MRNKYIIKKNSIETFEFCISKGVLRIDQLERLKRKTDIEIRKSFGVNEPIYLNGTYSIGDANEEVLEDIAYGYNVEVSELLSIMDDDFKESLEDKCERFINRHISYFIDEAAELCYTNIKYDYEDLKEDVEEWNTVLVDIHSPFSLLKCYRIETAHYSSDDFNDITNRVIDLDDFISYAEIGDFAIIDGNEYFKIYDEMSDKALIVYYDRRGNLYSL